MDLSKVEVDSKWIMAVIKKKFYDNSPIDFEDAQVQPAVPEGENFTSSVYRVTVKTRLGSGHLKDISIIVKRSSTGPVVEFFQPYDLFRNEVKIYNVFPRMDELMEEFDDSRERLWCDCYGYQPYTTIAFQDLKGFTTMDRMQWHSMEIAAYVLRAIGRFHAMSKVLLSRGVISKEDGASAHFIYTDTRTFRRVMPGSLEVLSKAIKETWGDKWGGVAERVRNQMPLICDKLKELMNTFDRRFEVLSHGDLWTNNLLWKFAEYGNAPIALRMVDFQCSIIYSFIWDVTYYLSTCIRPTVRKEKKQFLLETYHESLEKNLKFFGYKDYIPTLNDVYSEFDRIRYVQFAVLSYSLPITSGSADVTFDVTKVLTKSPEEFLNISIYTEDKYAKEVCIDLQDLCDEGII